MAACRWEAWGEYVCYPEMTREGYANRDDGVGSSCTTSADCVKGTRCVDGVCICSDVGCGRGMPCNTTQDCGNGLKCIDDECRQHNPFTPANIRDARRKQDRAFKRDEERRERELRRERRRLSKRRGHQEDDMLYLDRDR